MKKIILYVTLFLGYLGFREIKDSKKENKIQELKDQNTEAKNKILELETKVKAKEINNEIITSVNSGNVDPRLQRFHRNKRD